MIADLALRSVARPDTIRLWPGDVKAARNAEKLREAEAAAGGVPLLELRPWVRRTAALVATGSEVKKGLIQDTFTPS